MSWELLVASGLTPSTVLLRPIVPAVAAGLLILLLRVRHPASKHAIWTAATMAMLLVPVVSYFAPHWNLPVLPSKSAPAGVLEDTMPATLEFADVAQLVPSAPVAVSPRRPSLRVWFYLAGFGTLSFYRLVGWAFLRRVLARSTPLMGRTVRESSDVTSPAAVGVWRPVVMLPIEWRGWSPETRRAVLAHEFAHLRRRDTMISALGRLTTSLMWFHPLAWWLARHVKELAEQACDAVALENVGDPGGYSRILVAFASSVKQRGYRTALPGLAMAAKPSALGKRIDRVFEIANGGMRRLPRPGIIAALIGLPVTCVAAIAGVTASENLVLPALRPRVPAAPDVKFVAQVRTQTPPAATNRFEVVSIRPSTLDDPHALRLNSGSPGTLNIEYPLTVLLRLALKAEPYQVVGLPAWVDSANYAISGKTTQPAPLREMWAMLLPVLEERFELQFHREKREMQVYELSVSKAGKLAPPQAKNCFDPSGPLPPPVRVALGQRLPIECGSATMAPMNGGQYLFGATANMAALIPQLTFLLGRPVVDKTGLTEKFDFDLKFGEAPGLPRSQRPDAAASDLPDVFTALQDQLGLKTKSAKAPVEVIVIDRIERPTEN